jgi:outer membrane protein TolC
MRKKFKVWNFVIIILSLNISFSQEKLSLQDCINLALKNNQGVQIANESVSGSEYKVDESKSQYYPQITASGSYTRLSLISEMAFFNPFSMRMENIKFATPNNYNARLGISQQVFNWGKTDKMVEINEIGVSLSKDNVDYAKFIITYQIVPIFYGVLFTNEAIKVLDDNLTLLEKNSNIIKERYKSGLASSFDVSMVEVQISQLKGQRLDFTNNINKLFLTYNKITGRPSTSQFIPVGKFEYTPVELNKKVLYAEALNNRIEFQQLNHQEDLTRAQIELSSTGNKPNVIFAFNYEFRNGFMPEMDKIKGNWNAVLSASYPIFDGFKTKSQIEQGQSNFKVIEGKKIDLEQSIEMEIDQSISDLKTIEQKIEIEKLKIKQAEEALKIAEERYKSGLVSTTDFIAAQNSFESANLNYLQLIYNYINYTYSLYRAIGKKIY